MQWMILPFKRFADFRGRSRRKEFWMFQLLNIGLAMLLIVPAILLAPSNSSSDFTAEGDSFAAAADFQSDFADSPIALALIIAYGFYALAALIPAIAVTVRRLHDRDMSGWWYPGLAVAGLIPLIGVLASIALFVLTVLPGTAGSNRFGPDPKDPYSEDVFA